MKKLISLIFFVGIAAAQTRINGNRVLEGTFNYCPDEGSTDDYACNMSPAISGYVTGAHYFFKANTANTGSATINFNSLGAKTIKKLRDQDLATGDIEAAQFIEVIYDGTNMQMASQLASASGGGGGASAFEDLTDCKVSVSGSDINLSGCSVKVGPESALTTVGATPKINTTAGTGTVHMGVSSSSVFTAWHNVTGTCTTITCVPATSDPPSDANIFASVAVTSGTPGTITHKRSGWVWTPLAAGTGITITSSGGVKTISVSGSPVLLQSQTASASATLDFASCISTSYNTYQFVLENVLPATDGATISVRFSTDGGSSYDSGTNYSYWDTRYDSSATAQGGATGATSIVLAETTGIGNASAFGLVGDFLLHNPLNASQHKPLNGKITFRSAAGTRTAHNFNGVYESNTAANAVRFLASSGNITSGTIRCYGLAK